MFQNESPSTCFSWFNHLSPPQNFFVQSLPFFRKCWVSKYKILNKQQHSALSFGASWSYESHLKWPPPTVTHLHICTHIILYLSLLSPGCHHYLRLFFGTHTSTRTKMVSTPIREHPVTRQKLISVTPSVSLAPQLYLIPNHTHPVWTNLLFHSCCHISGVLNPAVYICHGNCNNGLSHCISCKKLLNGNTVMLITFRMFIRHKFIVTETKRFTCGSTWTLKVARVCCAFITLNDHLVEELGFKKQLFFFASSQHSWEACQFFFCQEKKTVCENRRFSSLALARNSKRIYC